MANIEDVTQALREIEFEFTGKSTSGRFAYRGFLQKELSQPFACEIEIDSEFLEIPNIRLLRLPMNLGPVIPHLAANGGLCYIAKGAVALDIFDPVGQTLACIVRADFVLGQILKKQLIPDLEEEFFAYWGQGGMCFLDIQDKRLGQHNSLVIEIGDTFVAVVTDDEARTKLKLESMGFKTVDYTILTYLVDTSAKPRPSLTNWPPRTVNNLLDWQGLLDPKCRRKIKQRIQEGASAKCNGALIIVKSPLMDYAFLVFYGEAASRNNSNMLKLSIDPVSVIRMDDKYIYERNSPGRVTLAGKRIALIGCGTIGGYLAEMLIKAGAGTSGGELTLVDNDSLLPQNLGRHRLGFPNLFHNKAKALANELSRLSPGAKLRPLPVNAMSANLGAIDLLIDATGEESLGHWLTKRYCSGTHMLSVWIEGQGIAVRSLLHTGTDDACYKCLTDANRRGLYTSIFGQIPQVFAGHGCEGLYVPFPASVSVQAASLASEAIMDWANGNLTPTLRTKITHPEYQLATPDCSPRRQESCPACLS